VTSQDAEPEARRAAAATISASASGRREVRAILVGVSDLIRLRDAMRQFSEDRDWTQFHDPKSLVLALTGEVGELAELFQWLPAGAATSLASEEPLRPRVGEEMADVLLYLVRLADVLDIDLAEVARQKLEGSVERFPVERYHGQAPEKR
jgi:dCTP diphosphatase